MSVHATPDPHPLLAVLADRAWMADARCRGRSHLFFEPFREAPPQRLVREASAKAICATCPVMLECRAAGRRNHESGIWGGETEEDRVLAGYPIRTVARRGVLKARREAAAARSMDLRDADEGAA